MKLTTQTNSAIYIALETETVTVKLWNTLNHPVPGLHVQTVLEGLIVSVLNGNDTVSDGQTKDTGVHHTIQLQQGEVLRAWCAMEDAVEFEIVTN